MTALLIALGVLVGLPGAVTSIHLTVLALASLFYKEPRPRAAQHLRFLIVIPAHNEAAVLG